MIRLASRSSVLLLMGFCVWVVSMLMYRFCFRRRTVGGGGITPLPEMWKDGFGVSSWRRGEVSACSRILL
ncbi:hypothetical protein L687_18705 [Microbacterium maritypicum MF109]|uniref:Uncharacterized protein n=1 Tax=Microbacterium maritypicum MF109 TaxID=1333857 RepID=T5KJZ0_MICMQ|nr:hypothetical protein L687_18705 [Microbacterium maritypicum MF109]